ncbi:MAG: hypothetical protein DI533_08795 [Cereibacter sphaeroides]|uniref:Glycosyltransferase family 2 protein n=1 Tax=Cereibacter sphaeroides TaxID=1063 RepID=A0A2W5TY33_CERSP|nr:MAG: hypothetical protein DI533_08795 [Cereibacter sphaeroides]
MRYSGLGVFLEQGRKALAKGPIAIIMAEDAVEVETTLRHHLGAGFAEVLVLAHRDLPIDPAVTQAVHRIDHDVHAEAALQHAVNRLIQAAPGIWMYYGYNAEYLFHPFCETRNIRELIAFHSEERRNACLSYVIDLYAADLDRFPGAVSLEEAHLDRSGYYALARPDAQNHNYPKERQLDFFGGLRWRFEEHVPPQRRKIDRIALFRAQPGLELRPDFTFNVEEYNTYACAWHHNVTTAVCSFRTAKALKSNAGSKYDIRSFRWRNSVPFDWHSQQLMDLGLMEPGQWF